MLVMTAGMAGTPTRPDQLLSVGKVAALCEVSVKVASNWVDRGLLPGWRVPGSSHRRVRYGDLVRSGFMQCATANEG